MSKHAYLFASASARWIACTKSAKECANAADTPSEYAKLGSEAHTLCEHLVLKALGRDAADPTGSLEHYDAEMQYHAEDYCGFVMTEIAEAKKIGGDVFVGVEQRLDLSRWVPDGFGTGDCVIAADGLIHIIDFKYGTGVLVSAERNSQLMCYALGAVDTFDTLYQTDKIRLSIFQPRRENISSYEMSVSELLTWADEVMAPAAKLAYAGEGEYAAGEHCRFCAAKAFCKTRAEQNMELAKYEFADPAHLSDDDVAEILPSLDNLVSWANDVKDYALKQALAGTRYSGFKLAEGRSARKYTDETAAAKAVEAAGYEPYEKKLKGITAMTSELGKKRFNEILGGLVYKPPGKPILIPADDKRPEINIHTNDSISDQEEKI